MQRLLFILISSLALTTISAQTKPKSNEKAAQTVETIKELLDAYKFSDATELIEKEVAAAKKKRLDTEAFEAFTDFANMGENMLNSTEKVTFIDSIVVDKNRFLEIYKLGDEAGRIDYFKNVFPGVAAKPAVAQSFTYTPQLCDKVYFSDAVDSAMYIFTRDRLDDVWSAPVQAKGLEQFGYDQISPFVLNDGTTMYFAAKGEQSLGGYDIYFTRFSADENKFLKPENLGMPFNSSANDYMYAVDEANNIGWFVSDRRQPEGKVCIYVFIPNATRENYAYEEDDALQNFAKINSIRDTWKGKTKEVNEALARLNALLADNKQNAKTEEFTFVVNDAKTYTSLDDFKNPEAQKYAVQWVEAQKLLSQQSAQLEAERNKYADAATGKKQSLAAGIIEQEKHVAELEGFVKKLEKLIRSSELGK